MWLPFDRCVFDRCVASGFSRKAAAGLVSLGLMSSACSPATMGMNRMAAALSDTAAAYGRDDDPELVRTGAPATLKMVEMMLDANPEHAGLLLTACSGFAQYAYAFLQVDSEILATSDARAAAALRERAVRMYSRARGYCVRELGTRRQPLREALEKDPKRVPSVLPAATKADVPALFWTAAALAGELSMVDNPLLRIGDLATVRALLTRALELDESWANGTIHEAMIAVEGLPALVGGSAVRAREHFQRAVALSEGHSAFAYVTLASSVSAPARDRAEFERTLKQAIAIDVTKRPELRLANLVAQKRARFLLANADRMLK
jgi:TRAP transporter T-component